MKKHWQYLRYILRHKWFVFKACLRLQVPLHLAIVHDWSKFLPDEWFPYADYFYNDKLQQKENIEAFRWFGIAELAPYGYYAKDRFNVAWLYHQRRNNTIGNTGILFKIQIQISRSLCQKSTPAKWLPIGLAQEWRLLAGLIRQNGTRKIKTKYFCAMKPVFLLKISCGV